MGLDMYLYEVSKPNRENGFIIDPLVENFEEGECTLSEKEFNALPQQYQELFVKGILKQTYINTALILEDIFNIPFKDMIVEARGKSYRCSESSSIYHIVIKQNNIINLPNGEQIFEETKGFQILYNCEYKEEEGIYRIVLTFREKYDGGANDYNGKYREEEEETVYVTIIDEIEYQRKGLDANGWIALPENCTYCADKSVVKALCKGGLSKKFLNNWVDGKTLFYAWW